MDENMFLYALKSKVEVCVRIAQVFGQAPLDFVLFFSSLNAFTKYPGQSNYAAGCTFSDSFASQLGQQWSSSKVKVMNWGYWGDVGVVATEDYRSRMEDLGLYSIKPDKAMDALEILMEGSIDQLVYYNGIENKVLNLEVENFK
jgi:polyketide synthase PksM